MVGLSLRYTLRAFSLLAGLILLMHPLIDHDKGINHKRDYNGTEYACCEKAVGVFRGKYSGEESEQVHSCNDYNTDNGGDTLDF